MALTCPSPFGILSLFRERRPKLVSQGIRLTGRSALVNSGVTMRNEACLVLSALVDVALVLSGCGKAGTRCQKN